MNIKIKILTALIPLFSFAGQKSVDESFAEGDVFELKSRTSFKNVDEDGKWGQSLGDGSNMCSIYVDKKLAGKVVSFDYLRSVKIKSVTQTADAFSDELNTYRRVVTYTLEDKPSSEGKEGVLKKIVCVGTPKSLASANAQGQPLIQSISNVFGVILDVTSDKSKKESLSVDATRSPRSPTTHGKAQQPI